MNKLELLHKLALNEPGVAISIVCPSLEGMKNLWNNCLHIFVVGAKRANKIEYIWQYPNGSLVFFQVFDRPEDCQGLVRDYLYIYNNVASDIYDKLVQRTKTMVFIEMVD